MCCSTVLQQQWLLQRVALCPLLPRVAVLNDVLALHNQLRAKHSAPPLTWSTALQQSAMAWAKSCSHEHSTNRQGDYNELIAWGNRPFTQAVTDEWYSGALSF